MDSNPTGRGGARPGAGRPPGSGTMMRVAKEARDQAIATGQLPHEILLSMARGEPQQTPVIDEEGKVLAYKFEVLPVADRRDAAKAAAPYYAPKISTVEVIAGVSDDDLDRIIASLTAETSPSPSIDRTGKEAEGEGGERSIDQTAPRSTGSGRERRRAKGID